MNATVKAKASGKGGKKDVTAKSQSPVSKADASANQSVPKASPKPRSAKDLGTVTETQVTQAPEPAAAPSPEELMELQVLTNKQELPHREAGTRVTRPVGFARPRKGFAERISDTNYSNTETSKLGNRLQAARNKADLSQDKVARMLEVSRPAYGQWELNLTQPSLDKIVRAAAILKVSPEYLAFGVEEGMLEKSFEDLDMVNIPEIDFEDGQEKVKQRWGFPRHQLLEYGLNPDTTAFVRVPHSEVADCVNVGDLLYVDRSKTYVSQPGVYVFQDGPVLNMAHLTPIPGEQALMRLAHGTHPISVKALKIIGRGVGATIRL